MRTLLKVNKNPSGIGPDQNSGLALSPFGGKVKIKANQTFLHERDRYEEGETYEVPLELGFYFCQTGWADSAEVSTGKNSGEVVDLDVHTAYLNQESRIVDG